MLFGIELTVFFHIHVCLSVMEDFHDIFTFGMDYAERMLDVIQIPFWVDVLKSVKALWRYPIITEVNNILFIPYGIMKLSDYHSNPFWFKKGIGIISDLLDDNFSLMSMDVFQDTYKIRTNFLEYGGFMLTLNFFLDNQEVLENKPTRPANSLFNNIMNRDIKGVFNLYKSMYSQRCDILGNICTKWYDKGGLDSLPIKSEAPSSTSLL